MRSRTAVALLVLAVVCMAASGCDHQTSGPLFSIRSNLHGAEPAGPITVVGFYKSGSSTVTLVAWLTRKGLACYGGVSTEFRDGTYDCSGQATALAKSGPPLVLGKPVFWVGPGFYIAFGFTRRVAAVRVTMFGKVIEPRLRHLGGGSAGVYAFPIPPHSGHGFSSGDITSVVGLAANGSIVSRAGPSASIMASPGRPAGQFKRSGGGT